MQTIIRLLFFSFTITLMCGVSKLNAEDLRIENQTHKKLSFKINHICSSTFGVIRPHRTKLIPEALFKAACSGQDSRCIVDVYHSGNCTHEHVATWQMRNDNGLERVLFSGPYVVTWRPFYVSLTEAIP